MSDDRKIIDGKSYLLTKYMVEDGLELLAVLNKKFAKPLGVLLEGIAGSTKESGNLSLSSLLDSEIKFSSILESFFEKLEPKELVQLTRDILKGTKIQIGNELHNVDLNIHFIGNYSGVFKLLGAVLYFQYADFLGGLFAKTKAPLVKENRVKALST
jgi:hypothetical protein